MSISFRMSSIQVTDIIYVAILFTQYGMTTPYSRPNFNDHFKADFSGKFEFEENIVLLHFLLNVMNNIQKSLVSCTISKRSINVTFSVE